MTREPIASFVLLLQHDPRTIWVVLHLYRRSLTLSILRTGSVHRSWDCEIDVRCDGSRQRLDCESGYGESRSVGFVEDCAIGDVVNEIGPSGQSGQKIVL